MENNRRELLGDLVAAAHRVTRIAASATGSTTPSSHRTILALLTRDGALRVGDIAARLRLTQPAVTQAVAALAAQGLVERRADPADGRATVVDLTPTGIAEAAAWRLALSDALAPMVGHLSTNDWAALERTAAILTEIDRSTK